ncbi:uracil-DNA glycosylase [Lophium mytilinum]|uniref:Uracil-DNA glycosylase n=1 Tax=Lophium mytilinum TaxID=390894 RepID=A0A6A6R8U4_9PEZI|nr:uracil-DNA glycosylase [Lophium mytilinum]
MSLKRKAAELATDAKKAKTASQGSITSFFGAPKPNPTKAATAPAKFDKEAWVEKLTEEQKELLKLEIDTLDESWLAQLKDEIVKDDFLDLKRFLKKEVANGTVYPPMKDVYSWSRHTPLHTVKAVILGQDPYHGPNQAHGLCFSVRPPTPAPPSLKNMYKALTKDYPDFKPPPKNSGLLTPWADHGVLLLNTVLTVRRGDANSHKGKGWEALTSKVIETVSRVRSNGVVFLCWGNSAAASVSKINSTKHHILKSVHPSPLSASKGFFDCGHFKKTNEWLVTRYGEGSEIDWNLDVDPEVAGV